MVAVNRHLALQDELALPGYAAMSDQERLDSLHLENIEQKTIITSERISQYLETINKWNQMNQLAVIDQSETPPVPRNNTAYHMVLVLDSFPQFDMANEEAATVLENLLTALVVNGILTQEEADTILAEGTTYISRDDEIGVPDSTIGEVEQARTN